MHAKIWTQVRQVKLGEELLTVLAFEWRHRGVRLPGLNSESFCCLADWETLSKLLRLFASQFPYLYMRMAHAPAFGGYSKDDILKENLKWKVLGT